MRGAVCKLPKPPGQQRGRQARRFSTEARRGTRRARTADRRAGCNFWGIPVQWEGDQGEGETRPAASRQNGSFRSCDGRRSSSHSGVRYIQCQDLASSLRRSFGLWAAQYPSGTRMQHPGCRHGLSGFCAIGLSPPGKTKSLRRHVPQFAVHVAQAHRLRLKSISRYFSLLQCRQ